MHTLHDKVAVITGAGSGIGAAIATSLAARGSHIVAVDNDPDRLATTTAALAAYGVKTFACVADIAHPEAFTHILDTTVTQLNAEQCAQTIHVPVVQLGDVSHDVSDFVALPQIVRWFQKLS